MSLQLLETPFIILHIITSAPVHNSNKQTHNQLKHRKYSQGGYDGDLDHKYDIVDVEVVAIDAEAALNKETLFQPTQLIKFLILFK